MTKLADALAAHVKGGNWRYAVELCRRYVEERCPLYRRDEVEVTCQSVSGWLITELQGRERQLLPESDKFRQTPEQADAELYGCIERWLDDVPKVYARRMTAIREFPPAEASVHATADRIRGRDEEVRKVAARVEGLKIRCDCCGGSAEEGGMRTLETIMCEQCMRKGLERDRLTRETGNPVG